MKRNYPTKHIEELEKQTKRQLINRVIGLEGKLMMWRAKCSKLRISLWHLKRVLTGILDNIIFNSEKNGEKALKRGSAKIHYYPGGKLHNGNPLRNRKTQEKSCI